MAIQFVCPSCQSKHASADHMAGRQFKCGGCGKILEVPPVGQAEAGAASPAPRRRPTLEAEEPADARHDLERGGMPVWMQVTLLVIGAIVGLVLLLACLLGLPFFLWTADVPPVQPPAVNPVDVEMKPAPPPVEPAKKE